VERRRSKALKSLGWKRPADQTGGDYYDWQSLPDGRLVVALADVTDTELAQLCSQQFVAPMQGLVSRVWRTDARDGANQRLAGWDIGEGNFVTFVTAVCAPGSSRVELLSAGHGPLFLYVFEG